MPSRAANRALQISVKAVGDRRPPGGLASLGRGLSDYPVRGHVFRNVVTAQSSRSSPGRPAFRPFRFAARFSLPGQGETLAPDTHAILDRLSPGENGNTQGSLPRSERAAPRLSRCPGTSEKIAGRLQLDTSIRPSRVPPSRRSISRAESRLAGCRHRGAIAAIGWSTNARCATPG